MNAKTQLAALAHFEAYRRAAEADRLARRIIIALHYDSDRARAHQIAEFLDQARERQRHEL